MRINISISENDLRVIDAYCQSERYSRSKLLVLGAFEFIHRNKPHTNLVEKAVIQNLNKITQQEEPKIEGIHTNTQVEELEKYASVHKDTQPSANIPPSKKCEISSPVPCHNPGIGKFKFTVYADGEEKTMEQELCAFHKNKIQKENSNVEAIIL